jgi:hypothetical protein
LPQSALCRLGFGLFGGIRSLGKAAEADGHPGFGHFLREVDAGSGAASGDDAVIFVLCAFFAFERVRADQFDQRLTRFFATEPIGARPGLADLCKFWRVDAVEAVILPADFQRVAIADDHSRAIGFTDRA